MPRRTPWRKALPVWPADRPLPRTRDPIDFDLGPWLAAHKHWRLWRRPASSERAWADQTRLAVLDLDSHMAELRARLGGHRGHPLDTLALGLWLAFRDWVLLALEGHSGVRRGVPQGRASKKGR